MNPNKKQEDQHDIETLKAIPNPEEKLYKIGEFQSQAIIEKILKQTAKQIFGDATIGDANKRYYVAEYRVNDAKELDTIGQEVFSVVRKLTPRSKLGQFQKRYGSLPHVGQKIKVENDEYGYWHVII